MPGKAQKVVTGGDSVGAALVRLDVNCDVIGTGDRLRTF